MEPLAGLRFTFTSLFALALTAGCSAQDDARRADDTQTTDGGARSSSSDRADASADSGPEDSSSSDNGTFVDPRDKRAYPTIRIGGKTWLARNLDFNVAGSSFCYDDVAANCDEYGRLYLWSAAPTACPPGWHLGSDAEWKDLEAAVGMDGSELELEGYSTVRGTNEGTTLKAANGFGALFAGFRTGTTYEARGDRTYFWTATTRGSEVWRRRISAADPTIFRFTNPPASFAISIRCVAD
jgi:uncharacterized protein (TIGR02145 family)